MSVGIYKIENLLNHKIYIGQSIEIENRWKKHLSAKDDFLIHQAIRKYGKSNFSFQIIEECDKLLLDEKENYWINYYNSLVPNGYNMIEGGSNGQGLSKGKVVLQYDLNGHFIAEYNSANQASQKTNIDHHSICDCCNSIYQQAGNFLWKYKDSDKKIVPIEKRINYTVLQIDKNDNIINEYETLQQASKITGIAKSTICNVCNGKGKTAGGFKWKYKYNN